MVALQCCMSLTKCKIKDNYFRNFSQSALFPDTKLTAELNNMLKFLNIIIYFGGKLFYGHNKTKKLASLKLSQFRPEIVQRDR